MWGCHLHGAVLELENLIGTITLVERNILPSSLFFQASINKSEIRQVTEFDYAVLVILLLVTKAQTMKWFT
jgi:hypothetical protein